MGGKPRGSQEVVQRLGIELAHRALFLRDNQKVNSGSRLCGLHALPICQAAKCECLPNEEVQIMDVETLLVRGLTVDLGACRTTFLSMIRD